MSNRLARIVPVLLINAVPLAGVLWFGGDIGFLFALFWAENLVIGGLNLARMLLAREQPYPYWFQLGFAAFFAIHFGLFCAGHAIFLRAFFIPGLEGHMSLNLVQHLRDFAGFYPAFTQSLAVVGLLHLGYWLHGLLREPGWRSGFMLVQMFQPYPRIVVLHITLLVGGFAVMGLGKPVWALVLLVVLKSMMDLGLGGLKIAEPPGMDKMREAIAQARSGQPPRG